MPNTNKPTKKPKNKQKIGIGFGQKFVGFLDFVNLKRGIVGSGTPCPLFYITDTIKDTISLQS